MQAHVTAGGEDAQEVSATAAKASWLQCSARLALQQHAQRVVVGRLALLIAWSDQAPNNRLQR